MFLALILFGCLGIDVTGTEFYQRIVLLEELRQVEVLSTVVGLLVEIHRTDTDLRFLEIRSDAYHEIVGSHVPKEPNEAAFIELDQLFGDTDRFEPRALHPIVDKPIAR